MAILKDWDIACSAVFHNCPDGFAKSYAKAGIGMTNEDVIRQQALYILGNMSHWRGSVAKECRATLKKYAGEAV